MQSDKEKREQDSLAPMLLALEPRVRAADLGFACSLAQDGCATRELRFAGTPVDAASVQVAYLAGLNGSFAAVKPAEELIAAL